MRTAFSNQWLQHEPVISPIRNRCSPVDILVVVLVVARLTSNRTVRILVNLPSYRMFLLLRMVLRISWGRTSFFYYLLHLFLFFCLRLPKRRQRHIHRLEQRCSLWRCDFIVPDWRTDYSSKLWNLMMGRFRIELDPEGLYINHTYIFCLNWHWRES